MEEVSVKLEWTKWYVHELLKESGLLELYSETEIENCFFDPFIFIGNPYKLARRITDSLIHSTSTANN